MGLPEISFEGHGEIEIVPVRRSTGQRPVKRHASDFEQVRHFLAALAVLDELPGVFDLLPGQLRFGSGPDASRTAAFIPACVRSIITARSNWCRAEFSRGSRVEGAKRFVSTA